jgi:hypothetical protein
MAFELTKYERSTSKAVSRINPGATPPTFLGHYSLQTPHSILCVRGNLFTEMTIIGRQRPSNDALTLMRNMMQRLDSHVAKHVVQRSQVRRPNLAFAQPAPASVKSESAFTVKMQNGDTLASQMYAKTSNGRLLLSAGPANDALEHQFFVLEKDVMIGDSATITISAAHLDTFHPGSVSFDVAVE